MNMRTGIKNVLRAILESGRDMLDGAVNFRETAVLCYHSISHAKVDTAVAPEAFRAQLSMLAARGYAFVPLADVVAWVKEAGSASWLIPRKSVALTFDDGYADFETAALPILEEFNAPTTVFVVGDEKASRPRLVNDIPLLSSEAIERLRAHPLIEIGYHSTTHENTGTLTDEAMAAEVRAPFAARFYAYPGGKHDARIRASVAAAGYEAACTIRPVLARKDGDVHQIPRSVITRAMSLERVRFQATRAADWYYRLAHLL